MTQEKFDLALDRVSKIAGILLPLVIAVVGGIYTYQKDKSDKYERDRSAEQQLSPLLPLLLSDDERQVTAALAIYNDEAARGLAPLSLIPIIQQLANTKPQSRAQAQLVEQAASLQAGTDCKEFPNGLFLQVANDTEQLKNGQALAALLKSQAGLPPIPGVQRVDAVPQQTQLRYYFSSTNDAQAEKVIAGLHQLGFAGVAKQDLSALYLKNKNCTPPPTFELWIGSADALDAQGLPHGLTKPTTAK